MYIRKLESLNRCVIPQHLRKQMQVNKGDYMMVSLSANELVAYKYTDNIFSYSNKSLAGIPRKIDSLGRLVILKEYARQLNLQVGEFLEILQLPDSPYLSIKRRGSHCALCGKGHAETHIDEKAFCNECIQKIAKSFSMKAGQPSTAAEKQGRNG